METLPAVEEAKALMNEAIHWSVMKWLREKKRVRKVADAANAALDKLQAEVHAKWNTEQKRAYADVNCREPLACRLRQADADARKARDDAESTFDEAERELSTSLAREGCRKAIASWDLLQSAIELAESAIPKPSKH
ncbi:MAG TPA: hypothetical protein VN577_03570 [Terriglobales bacterium]|nr:hypothetical protein [Terriglobales bacterium]